MTQSNAIELEGPLFGGLGFQLLDTHTGPKPNLDEVLKLAVNPEN